MVLTLEVWHPIATDGQPDVASSVCSALPGSVRIGRPERSRFHHSSALKAAVTGFYPQVVLIFFGASVRGASQEHSWSRCQTFGILPMKRSIVWAITKSGWTSAT